MVHRAPDRLSPYPHDPGRAASLWQEPDASLRVAAARHLEPAARLVAADLEAALPIRVELQLLDPGDYEEARRALAERKRPRPWHVLLFEHVCQAVDSIALELHRGFAAADGEYRAGPEVPQVDELMADLAGIRSPTRQMIETGRLDRLVRDEALALFLCSPQKLYAVNREVRFKPYATSFELAETEVTERHWSRR